MSISIVEFGRQVARALGSGAHATRLAKQEAAVVAYALRKNRNWLTMPRMRWLATGALGATAAVGLYLTSSMTDHDDAPNPNAPLERHGGSAEYSGRRWFELKDGSQLAADGDAKLEVLDQDDVRVRLFSGQVNVRVTKQRDRDWVLVAGPYRVAVVGTQFDVSFDAKGRRFAVRVTEGLVRVFGAELPSEGLSLQGGQEYAIDQALVTGASLPDGGVSPEAEPKPKVGTSAENAAATISPQAASGAPAATWRQACAAGRYAEAFTQDTEQLPRLLEQSSEGELLEFANCLRYAGRSTDAERALLKLRDRFPRSRGAILSSYHLARLSQRKGKNDAARQWFETYLAESPKGQLAASARAELVRLWLEQGNIPRARAGAREYLRKHPHGSFAPQATDLLSGSAMTK